MDEPILSGRYAGSPEMKAAWHERYGGSPKHDHPSEEFAAGWEAALETVKASGKAARQAWTAEHVDRVLKAQALARKLKTTDAAWEAEKADWCCRGHWITGTASTREKS